MDGRRRFNAREHAALYLAADGLCALCGAELESGWHADHMQPHARGGVTDVVNGQALCPRCNLVKGAQVDLPMRLWQQVALDRYITAAKRDFLLEATPGAGKTRLAVALARRLIDDGTIRQVAVVVPTDALRLQWADAGGPVRLRPLDDGIAAKTGYDGVVLTYAQLARGASADLLRRDVGRTPTLAIFDEIHHAGRERSWSEGLVRAFEHSTRRLALTGTPWRSDNRRIPFVRYGPDGKVKPDYDYGYGHAVNDRICRPVVFHAYNGEARWVDCGQVIEATVGEDLDDERVGAALDTLYHPAQTWIPELLAKAVKSLDAMRATVPDAGGLVIAEQQWHAKAYAQILHRLTGEQPTIVISEDGDEAKAKIDAYRGDTSRWLVAVRMISEGIDIPRLSLGVYAAKARTPLFFRQVVGRFVRMRGNEEHNAELFIPAVPAIMRHAFEIEQELRHELAEEEQIEARARKDAEERQQTLDFRMPLSTSEPEFLQAIHRGHGFEQSDHEEGVAFCQRAGLPTNFAANVARELRNLRAVEVTGEITVRPATAVEPQHRLERRLRQEVERLARRLDMRENRDPGATNGEIRTRGFPARKQCSIDQLQQIRGYLAGRLGDA